MQKFAAARRFAPSRQQRAPHELYGLPRGPALTFPIAPCAALSAPSSLRPPPTRAPTSRRFPRSLPSPAPIPLPTVRSSLLSEISSEPITDPRPRFGAAFCCIARSERVFLVA